MQAVKALPLTIAHTGTIVLVVVFSTRSQALQPPFKTPQAFWKGKSPFPSKII
jgi:hypothetical protein